MAGLKSLALYSRGVGGLGGRWGAPQPRVRSSAGRGGVAAMTPGGVAATGVELAAAGGFASSTETSGAAAPGGMLLVTELLGGVLVVTELLAPSRFETVVDMVLRGQEGRGGGEGRVRCQAC